MRKRLNHTGARGEFRPGRSAAGVTGAANRSSTFCGGTTSRARSRSPRQMGPTLPMSHVSQNLSPRWSELAPVFRALDRVPTLRNVIAFCLFECAFYLAYRYGMSFSQATAAPFWFPDPVLICTLLLVPPRWWWLFLLATLPIRLFVAVPADAPLWLLVSAFSIDCAKAVVGAYLVLRFMRDPLRFGTIREFVLYCLTVVLLIPATSAFAGAAIRSAVGHRYWASWESWFLGDALASLLITPALFYWVLRPPKPRQLSGRRSVEALLLTCGLLLSIALALKPGAAAPASADARAYVPVLFLFWAAIRFGMLGASGAGAMLTIVAVCSELSDHPPFAGRSPTDTAVALQGFLLIQVAPVYLLAVLTEHVGRVERSLRESAQRFRNIADTAPALIWLSGADKLRHFFNKRWLEFTGRTLDGERGNGWLAGVHEADVQRCTAVYHSAFDARRPFEMDYRLRRHDGEYRWLLDRGLPRYDDRGVYLGFIGSAIDITDRREVEEATRSLTQRARLAALGEFASMVAHEVSQPLGAMLLNAEAAERLLQTAPHPSSEVRTILAAIYNDGLRADQTIRRIRALTGRSAMLLRPLDLNKLIEDVVHLVVGDARRRYVRIRRELGTDLPQALADPAYLEQVLLNLIFNGMDALSDIPGEREILVQTRRNEHDSLEIAVSDNGRGIADDEMPKLFDSFFTTKPDAVGLGLSIARSIVRGHEGRIWAENRPSGGAVVRFTVRTVPSAASGRKEES